MMARKEVDPWTFIIMLALALALAIAASIYQHYDQTPDPEVYYYNV
jgi:hypothetical protein